MGKRKRYSKQKMEKEHFTNSTESESEEDLKKSQGADIEEDEADDEGEETEDPKHRKGKSTNDSDEEIEDDNKVQVKNEAKTEHKNTGGEDDVEYEVECIVDDRKVKGRTQYRVRWKGFSTAHDTWENEENLDCENLLNEYLSSKGQSSNDESTEKRKNNKIPPKIKKGPPEKKTNAQGNKKTRVDVRPDENGEFEVSRIIDMHVAKNGKHEYLVLWKGFPFSESSWEPEEHVKDTAAYERFLKKLEEAKSKTVKELRVSRRPTDRFTMTYHDKGRRLSRRFENKQRAKYFEAE
ncbi:uncharacterized protein isoform X3 [Rhodnius prolixus]|uniref:uncharacterized protein isoform X3 n=1 Tax=Rhodnius prolixus TaxID=13249 RepID=UPI003D18A55A